MSKLLTILFCLYNILTVILCSNEDAEWIAIQILGGVDSNDIEYESLRFNDLFGTYKGTIQERNDKFKPGLIFTPSNEQEITKIVKYANKYNKTIVAKSGGHSYSGLSSCNDINCIQIRMDNFNYTNLNYDDNDKIRSITVGSGQKLGDMHDQLIGHNVTILSGICEGVGAGGHYQTSSIGALGRSLGLGMDYITSVKVVTSTGHIIIASQTNKYRDLYWAILGGSPGAFGIVIEYIFEPIRDEHYPNSYAASYTFAYTSNVFRESMILFFSLLNNPIYQQTTDMSMIITVNPLLSNPDDTESQFSNGLFIWLTWTGINGDINSIIPRSTSNKTYYDEFFLPFKNLNDAQRIRPDIDGYLPISHISRLYVTSELGIPVEPFRYNNWNRNYDLNMINEIGKYGISNYIDDKFMDSMDYITKLNPNDIDIMFQMWNLNPSPNLNKIDINPMINNLNSYPLRNIIVQIDSWILFNQNDIKLFNESKFYAEKLKNDSGSDITHKNNKDIRTFAFSDCDYDSCDLSKNWQFYYNDNHELYNKLKQIKHKYDRNDIFHAPLTVPVDDHDDDCAV